MTHPIIVGPRRLPNPNPNQVCAVNVPTTVQEALDNQAYAAAHNMTNHGTDEVFTKIIVEHIKLTDELNKDPTNTLLQTKLLTINLLVQRAFWHRHALDDVFLLSECRTVCKATKAEDVEALREEVRKRPLNLPMQ